MKFDYKKLGLKVGLECHQQLDVGKLFCRCPSTLREDAPDIVFRRNIRPVPSELGEYDEAALEAFHKGLSYVYQAYSDTTCEIEADEAPPRPINQKALETVLQVALLIDANVLAEAFVMRKGIFDGSNVSGFQRTLLVATGGKLNLGKGKKLGIMALILEEDAARLIEKKEKEITYRLDRLGIPLIELATEPELFTPEEAAQAALKIGELFRITGKAKRGLGSIRQDINVSIKEGARVEIKGIQELEMIGEYVKREIQRQLALIAIKKELAKRKVSEKELKPSFISLGDQLKGTSSKLFKGNLEKGNLAFGLKLKGFKGLLGKEIQPNRRFGTELADHVKTKTRLHGLIHSDEMPGYGLSKADLKAIEKDLKIGQEDGYVMVLGPETECIKGLEAVLARAKQALQDIPNETRGAIEEGNTEYQRILGGAARMYPETDLPAIKIRASQLAELKKSLPLWAEERKKLYLKKYRLNEKLAGKMVLSNWAPFYESLLKKGFDPTASAVLLLEDLVQMKRDKVAVENISEEMIEAVLKALKEKTLTKDVLAEVLKVWSSQPFKPLEDIVKEMNISKVESKDLKQIIQAILKKNQKMVEEKGQHAFGALMGEVMKEVKGKASGSEISKVLKEELGKLVK